MQYIVKPDLLACPNPVLRDGCYTRLFGFGKTRVGISTYGSTYCNQYGAPTLESGVPELSLSPLRFRRIWGYKACTGFDMARTGWGARSLKWARNLTKLPQILSVQSGPRLRLKGP